MANAAIFDEKSGMKYIMFFDGGHDELYNIKKDIGETKNIIDQSPEIAQYLRKNLKKYLTKKKNITFKEFIFNSCNGINIQGEIYSNEILLMLYKNE